MRWPWQKADPWTVRLHLFGPSIDVDGEPIAGAYTTRLIRADSVPAARQAAVAEAERDLRRVARLPRDERLRWSIESIEEGRPEDDEDVNVFLFYREGDESLSSTLNDLARSLAGNDVQLYVGEGRIVIVAEDEEGFSVEIGDEEDGFGVYANEWHSHYEDARQAVACFRWLLTPYYRTVVETQGGERVAAWIERYENLGWKPIDHLLYRNPGDPTKWLGSNWRREYRQQAVLRPPTPYTTLFPEAWLDADDMPEGSTLGTRFEEHDRSFVVEQGWLETNYGFDARRPPENT